MLQLHQLDKLNKMILIDIVIGLILIVLIGKALTETAYGLFLIALGALMTILSKFFGVLAWVTAKFKY